MTVNQALQELMALHKAGYGDAILVQSGDSEGNDYRNSHGFTEGYFKADSTWEGEFIPGINQEEVDELQGEHYDISGHKKAVCLWPVN